MHLSPSVEIIFDQNQTFVSIFNACKRCAEQPKCTLGGAYILFGLKYVHLPNCYKVLILCTRIKPLKLHVQLHQFLRVETFK